MLFMWRKHTLLRIFQRIFVCALCVFGLTNTAWADEITYPITLKVKSDMPINTTFQFGIAAKGTFYVDCGENGTLSVTNATKSGNTITKPSATVSNIACKYTGALAERTIRIGGLAEAYNSRCTASYATMRSSTTTQTYLSSIEGDLSTVFPSYGTAVNQNPCFYSTFKDCTALTSISNNLFAGYTVGIANMFNQTFYGCTGLTDPIPPTLFSGLIANNATASGMMTNTFASSGFAESCDTNSGYRIYETPYDTSWSPKVSCTQIATCSSGYYLPANSSTCTECPQIGYTCDGGDFIPGFPDAQGLVPNQYTCSEGYYLPANSTICAVCPNGHICSGGTFDFNPTKDSGAAPIEFTATAGPTTNGASYNSLTVKFDLSAAGTFYVDCGEYGELAGTGVSGKKIDRSSNITKSTYTCTYSLPSATTAPRTISFGGKATGYNTGTSTAAISFDYSSPTFKLRSIDGDLSKLFPYISSSSGAHPSFTSTFANQNLLSQVPSTLFSEYTLGGSNMFQNTFKGCTSLTSIPSGLFSAITGSGASMFAGTFQGCTSLTSIPAGLFSGITLGADYMFDSTFQGCTSLTSIPSGLFSGISSVGNYMFQNTFNGCINLTSIPPDLFSSSITPGTIYTNNGKFMFAGTFQGCTNLKVIPSNLFNGITSGGQYMFQNTFNGCTSLTSIPGELFSRITTSTSPNYIFSGTFQGCTGLTTIPASLFSRITFTGTYMFQNTFKDCTSLTSIPSGLFSGITGVGTSYMFAGTFQNCTSLTSIPSELFSGITGVNAYMFQNTFNGCTGLVALPAGLFSQFTSGSGEVFNSTFAGCTGLSGYIPPTLFDGLITNNATYARNMMANIFSNTGLDETCPDGTEQYETPYDTYWAPKLSCTGVSCASGQYLPANSTTCASCLTGYICNGGNFAKNYPVDQGLTPNQYNCTSGQYLPANSTTCASCLTGYSCSAQSYYFDPVYDQGLKPRTYTCNSGKYLPANSVTCATCPEGYTCDGGKYDFNPTIDQGAVPNTTTCSNGYYLPANSSVCTSCPQIGYTCNGGNFYRDHPTDQGLTPNSYTCDNGKYLPANAISCANCPTGHTCGGGTYYFNPAINQGATPNTYTVTYDCGAGTGSIPNGSAIYGTFFTPATSNCTVPNGYSGFDGWTISGTQTVASVAFTWNYIESKTFTAHYTPNSYTCSNGYYLPANSTTCATCPNNYICGGGTYDFNPTIDQGATPNTINCSNGYYLPANSSVCEECLTGYTCIGGDFTLNLPAAQGLTPNTINTSWYDGTNLVSSNTCSYSGAINIPNALNRPGYTFDGWKLKMCKIPYSSAVSDIIGKVYYDSQTNTVKRASGTPSAALYALPLQEFQWAQQLSSGDIVIGDAFCAGSDISNYGEPGDSGMYMWCRVLGYIPNGGEQCQFTTPNYRIVLNVSSLDYAHCVQQAVYNGWNKSCGASDENSYGNNILY